jgi:hypothetical protein
MGLLLGMNCRGLHAGMLYPTLPKCDANDWCVVALGSTQELGMFDG